VLSDVILLSQKAEIMLTACFTSEPETVFLLLFSTNYLCIFAFCVIDIMRTFIFLSSEGLR